MNNSYRQWTLELPNSLKRMFLFQGLTVWPGQDLAVSGISVFILKQGTGPEVVQVCEPSWISYSAQDAPYLPISLILCTSPQPLLSVLLSRMENSEQVMQILCHLYKENYIWLLVFRYFAFGWYSEKFLFIGWIIHHLIKGINKVDSMSWRLVTSKSNL